MFRHKGLAKLAGVVGASAMALTGMLVTGTANADPPSGSMVGPQISATSGDGRLSAAINWVQWNDVDGVDINGATAKWMDATNAGDGYWLNTRCEITPDGSDPLSGTNQMQSYLPGDWFGDGLVQLYNNKSSNPADENTMTIGLANKTQGAKITFKYSCTAYLIQSPTRPVYTTETVPTTSYQEVPLQGMVFADAESNNWETGGQHEYIKATPVPEPGKTPKWRLIDSYRTPSCSTNSVADRNGDTVRFRSDGSQCGNHGQQGPSSVMFLENSEQADVEIKGGGKTAIALGVVAATDFGDAPGVNPGVTPSPGAADYKVGSSLMQPQWEGGELGGTGADDISSSVPTPSDTEDPDYPLAPGWVTYNLSQARDTNKVADMAASVPRLGVWEDPESRRHFSTNADWDDLNGKADPTDPTKAVSDEDGLKDAPHNNTPTDKNVKILPTGNTFTQAVSCATDTAAARVKGWIDWNHNGVFDETTEASDQVQCVGSVPSGGNYSQGTATLTWTIPSDAKRSVKGETASGQTFERVRITGDTGPLGTASVGTLAASGITTTNGEVEDYAVDVYIPTLSVLMNLPDGRYAGSDQFAMTVKDSTDGIVGSATTTGGLPGVQTDQIAPTSVKSGSQYTLAAPLDAGSASGESRYSTELTCEDLATNPATPVTVTDGKITTPTSYDSNIQCTYKKLIRSNPTLTVTTHIAGGGTATTADFPVTATPTAGGSAVGLPDGTGLPLPEGSYKISTDMSSKPGYEVTSPLACTLGGSPISLTDATVAMANGDSVVCEQTVAPKTPTLTLKTEVERGSATPGDFNFTVNPTTGDPVTYAEGVPQAPPAGGIASVVGSEKANYVESAAIVYYKDSDVNHTTPLTLAEAQTALNNGESVTGIRKVTTHQPKLTVKLDRDYRFGGTASGDGSKITLNQQGGSGQDVTLDQPEYVAAGTYSVFQLLKAGYKQSDIKVTLADGTSVAINPDGTFNVPDDADVVIALKNVDEPGTLEWSRFDQDGKTLLSGSKWRLNGPDGQSLDIEDCTAEVCTGLDKDPTPGKFSVTGLKWGDWTITETIAPLGHRLSKPLALTLNPAEGQYGLLKMGAFKDGKCANVTPGVKLDPDFNAELGQSAKEPGQNVKKPGPRLSATGSDIAVVVMVAFATLALGLVLATGATKVLSRREE
ncbi:CshA/CshB family fibrillar adhesin-related protein [Bifidobacterium sp. ESL0798]|uniref:CshA/CshB family fibrillar adhesin-related protein n=1 Tax=Bifidobacterium sp. ESL0798 TaxID=2983235 RepID=UPI0023F6A415|nr:CshA/CshB family fibrillar adhesin-related protein [Bifidobacterium sp. ESL0798]WEV74022.1 CshA/CshB family fibrillar adhesin-related protein [Bifidobacterium sp. ESL0798]